MYKWKKNHPKKVKYEENNWNFWKTKFNMLMKWSKDTVQRAWARKYTRETKSTTFVVNICALVAKNPMTFTSRPSFLQNGNWVRSAPPPLLRLTSLGGNFALHSLDCFSSVLPVSWYYLLLDNFVTFAVRRFPRSESDTLARILIGA